MKATQLSPSNPVLCCHSFPAIISSCNAEDTRLDVGKPAGIQPITLFPIGFRNDGSHLFQTRKLDLNHMPVANANPENSPWVLSATWGRASELSPTPGTAQELTFHAAAFKTDSLGNEEPRTSRLFSRTQVHTVLLVRGGRQERTATPLTLRPTPAPEFLDFPKIFRFQRRPLPAVMSLLPCDGSV